MTKQKVKTEEDYRKAENSYWLKNIVKRKIDKYRHREQKDSQVSNCISFLTEKYFFEKIRQNATSLMLPLSFHELFGSGTFLSSLCTLQVEIVST